MSVIDALETSMSLPGCSSCALKMRNRSARSVIIVRARTLECFTPQPVRIFWQKDHRESAVDPYHHPLLVRMGRDLAWPAPCEQLCERLLGTPGSFVWQCAQKRRPERRDGAVEYNHRRFADRRRRFRRIGGQRWQRR